MVLTGFGIYFHLWSCDFNYKCKTILQSLAKPIRYYSQEISKSFYQQKLIINAHRILSFYQIKVKLKNKIKKKKRNYATNIFRNQQSDIELDILVM